MRRFAYNLQPADARPLTRASYFESDQEIRERAPSPANRMSSNRQRVIDHDTVLFTADDSVSAILNNVGAPIIFLDRNGRIVQFNSECERLTGYTAAEMIGRTSWEALLPIIERGAARDAFGRLLSQHRTSRGENHWITRGGERRLISWANTVMLDASGDVEFVISTGNDITDRLRMEREIVEVSEEERRRIGHEIHERLCNHLAGTALIMEALAQDVRRGNAIDLDGLEHATHLVSAAVEHAGALARGLVPVTIEQEGLVAALEEMTADVQDATDISCDIAAGGDLPELAHTSSANHLYRIAQEAVANAAEHGRPTQIRVSLRYTGEEFVLTIHDDGIGITTDPPPSGLGMHMMRYRARMMGGALVVSSRPGGSTEVRCTVPLFSGTSVSSLNGTSPPHETDSVTDD